MNSTSKRSTVALRLAARAACWLTLASATAAAFATEVVGTTATLRLNNGDFIAGRLADCDEPGCLAWQSNACTGPFRFPLTHVASVRMPRGAARKPVAELAVGLSGGDLLFGSLIELSDEWLELESTCLGRVRIAVPQIVRLEPLRHESLRYHGPQGLAGWTTADEGVWSDDAGRITAEAPGVIFLDDCAIPKRARIEVELSWKFKPDFSISFGGRRAGLEQIMLDPAAMVGGRRIVATSDESVTPLFSLEVWAGGALALLRESAIDADVASVASLPDRGPGQLRLQIFYDEAAGRVSVYSVAGKLLGTVAASTTPQAGDRGIRLENKRGDLALEDLSVHEWGGESPEEVDVARRRLQRMNGQVTYGEAIQYDSATKEFVIQTDSGDQIRAPIADVDHVALNSAGEVLDCTVRVAMDDGSRLCGALEGVASGALQLKRPGLANLVRLPFTRLGSISRLIPAQPPAAHASRHGRLESSDARLHGVLVEASGADGFSALAWQPHGSEFASTLRPGVAAKIVYRDPAPPAENAKGKAVAAGQPFPLPEIGQLRVIEDAGGVPRIRVVRTTGPAVGILWLKGGDRLTCELTSIDELGVRFRSPQVEAEFLPHKLVKAWERLGEASRLPVDEKKRERLLSLPRMMRTHPPTHLIQSSSGDLLRGRLQAMDEKILTIEVRLEPRRLSAEKVTRIIWLDDVEQSGEDDSQRQDLQAPAPADTAPDMLLQAVRQDGARLTFAPTGFRNGEIAGRSESLGPCEIDVAAIDALYVGEAIAEAARGLEYHEWQLRSAADPQFVKGDAAAGGGTSAEAPSEFSGKPAPDFTLERLGGGEFQLSQSRGRIVVLDFWASWCGPCMRVMPLVDEVAKNCDAEKVEFLAVNMQEGRDTIEESLERISLQPTVLLDVDGVAAAKYAVTALPQTVVIDAEGNVAAVLIGSHPDFVAALTEAIQKAQGGGL